MVAGIWIQSRVYFPKHENSLIPRGETNFVNLQEHPHDRGEIMAVLKNQAGNMDLIAFESKPCEIVKKLPIPAENG